MMIKAKIIADSKNQFGNRITTMVITFPRIILAEFNTHRMFSRNSASSRAIPFDKMVESIQNNPFVPIAWQKDHKGMQGNEYLDDRDVEVCKSAWLVACGRAIDQAKHIHDRGATKQLCNRLLEPYMWHTAIVTATEWENFFALRCPKYQPIDNSKDLYLRSRKDVMKALHVLEPPQQGEKYWQDINKGQAEIHMMALAEAMWDAMNESTPNELKAGQWHIPFGDDIKLSDPSKQGYIQDFEGNTVDLIQKYEIKIATARCARVSYTVVGEEGKESNYGNDIKLHDRLAESGHWSPFEHCAKAMNEIEYTHNLRGEVSFTGDKDSRLLREYNSEGWSGNFKGFIQYRKMFNNENIVKVEAL